MIKRIIMLLKIKIFYIISSLIIFPFTIITSLLLNIINPTLVDDITKVKSQIDLNNLPFVHETTRTTSTNINKDICKR